MKARFTAGFLMVVAVVLLTLSARVGESLSLGAADAALKSDSEVVVNRKIENKVEDKISNPAETAQSLEDVVNEVLAHNPELQFYEAEIKVAKGLRKTAGLWSNPEVSGSVGQKRVISSADGETTTAKGVASEIAVTQSIEWPGRIRLRKAIADRDIKLAELGLEQFRALLVGRVKIAAYILVATQDKAAATREVASHFRSLREVLIQRDQAGLTPLLETRIIEALELNIQRKASAATLASQAALLDLNQLRGAPPDAPLALTKLNLNFLPLKTNKEELIALARVNDYSVRTRAMELEGQGYRVRLAKNERFPAISAGPAITQERAGDRERVIGAAISLPLPLWNRNQGGIAVAKAQQTQAETSFNIAQREAERRAVQAATTYETKLREMANWQPDSIQHFKEAAELADRHYRLGSVPVSTYVDLQSQYLDTIEGLQDTKKEALESATQLELLTGTDLLLIETTGESQ